MLLEKGADVNMQGGYYGSGLHHENIVHLVLEKGAGQRAGGKSSVLCAASSCGDEDIVRLLPEKGADVKSDVMLYILADHGVPGPVCTDNLP